MNRAKSICRRAGCNVLLDAPGYCEQHKVDPFKQLQAKKTDSQKQFYSSYKWTMKSRDHRSKFPLCEQCKKRGLTVPGQMVHHNSDLTELWAQNLDPLSDKYLETLCNLCHLDELRKKKI